MSEASGLAKIVLVLGVFAFLIAALYPAQDTGWDSFSSTASSFPQFSNPFDAKGTKEYDVVANGSVLSGGNWFSDPPDDTSNDAGFAHCSDSDWWQCVSTKDANESYATITAGGDDQFTVNMSSDVGGASNFLVIDFVVSIQCSFPSGETGFTFNLYLSNGSTNFVVTTNPDLCSGSTFQNYSFRNDLDVAHLVSEFDANGLKLIVTADSGSADISYVHLTVHYGRMEVCGGGLDGIVCMMGWILNTAIDGFLFIINGLIFIGSAMVWLVQMAVSFFGIIGSAMSLPGVPTEIQTIINVVLIALVIMLVIAVFRIVRGSGSTG